MSEDNRDKNNPSPGGARTKGEASVRAAAGTQGRGREWTVQGSRQADSHCGSSADQLCDLGKSLNLSGL